MYQLTNVALSTGGITDILIDGSKITRIGKGPSHFEFINALGLLAVPGPIDPHVHFRVPGGKYKEDWKTGQMAALRGGVTTVFDMPNTWPPLTTAEGVKRKLGCITKPIMLNFRFWFGATSNNLVEIRKIANDSNLKQYIVGVKVFMGSSTGDLLVTDEKILRNIFRVCVECDFVVAVHAENEEVIRRNRIDLSQQPLISDHSLIRDTESEVVSVVKALRLQKETGCKLYFCHLSTPEAVKLAKEAKDRGAEVYVEVSPHHLWLTDEKLLSFDGALFKINPPLRSRMQVERLREFLCEDGFIDTVGSDHAPHTLREKLDSFDYDQIPSGVPGVQTLLSLIFNFVSEGRMSLERFIDLTSKNAARIFGLKGEGEIAVGNNANLVLIDPNREMSFSHGDMASKCKWTPYHGMKAKGVPVAVVSFGKFMKIN